MHLPASARADVGEKRDGNGAIRSGFFGGVLDVRSRWKILAVAWRGACSRVFVFNSVVFHIVGVVFFMSESEAVV